MDIQSKSIALVCSDPGGAQPIVSLCGFLRARGARSFIVSSRSGSHFARDYGIDICRDERAYGAQRSIADFIADIRCHCIVTGTSGKVDLERNYIQAGRRLAVPTIALVDWWSNYRQRFVHARTGAVCLPDWIGVIDDVAKRQCRKEIGGRVKLVVTGHPRFGRIRRNGHLVVDRPSAAARTIILFFAEPLYRGYDQFAIFERVAREVARIAPRLRTEIEMIVKFHPNGETPAIYRQYETIASRELRKTAVVRFVRKQYNAAELVGSVDYVWGISTAPMFEAMLRGKPVSSFLPRDILPATPLARSMGFCPSADAYSQYPGLIRRLLTEPAFVRASLRRQAKYRLPRIDFFNSVSRIIYTAVSSKGRHEETARD